MRLFYREAGTGPLVVILHGLFGSSDNWHTIASGLTDRFRVVTPDLRNHGRSPHDPVFTYAALAGDVAELIAGLSNEPASLVGHSMGGKTAIELAVSRPELVARLVAVDIGPKAYEPHHEDLRDALLSIDPARLRARKEADDLLAMRVPDPSLRLFLLKNLGRDDAGNLFWRLDLASIASSFAEIWKEVGRGRHFAGPALFLRGARSEYVLDSDIDGIRASFPLAEVVTIPNAGHWVNADQPELLIEELRAFLQP